MADDIRVIAYITALLLGLIMSLWGAILFGAYIIAEIKKWHRRRKTDARIIAQAKAAGVWDKPMALGGRALELKLEQAIGMKRKQGETDAELRRRYEIKIVTACAFALGIPALVLWDEYKAGRKRENE